MYNNSGQTLLEAVVAIGILVVILTASATAIITSINNATFTKNQNLANKHAQEGMEYIRNLKRSNFGTFNLIAEGVYCMDDDAARTRTNAVGSCTTVNIADGTSQFIRELKIIKTDSPADSVDCPNCGKPAYNSTDCPLGQEDDCAPCSASAIDPLTSTEIPYFGKQVIIRTKWSSGKCPTTNLFCHESKLESCFIQL